MDIFRNRLLEINDSNAILRKEETFLSDKLKGLTNERDELDEYMNNLLYKCRDKVVTYNIMEKLEHMDTQREKLNREKDKIFKRINVLREKLSYNAEQLDMLSINKIIYISISNENTSCDEECVQ